MCTIQAIPTEVHDMIVDHLHSDKRALAACALAFRDWLPTGRYHLFRSIALGPSSSKRILSLLESPYCTILPFVRALNLEEGRGRYACDDIRWLNRDATGCIKRLVGLKRLYLRNVEWEGLELEAQADFMEIFRGVTDLHLYCANFRPFARIIGDFPNAFANIQRLVVSVETSLHSGANLQPPQNTEPGTNKQLTVRAREKPSHIQTPTIVSNRIVHLVNIRCSWTTSVDRLLQNFGPSLRHLRIGFAPGACIDISPNSQLRIIHFDDLGLFSDQLRQHQQCLPLILSQITSTVLEEIIFSLWISYAERDLDEDIWSYIAVLLRREQFANVAKIRFIVHGHVAVQEVEEWMGWRLPEQRERRLLKFV